MWSPDLIIFTTNVIKRSVLNRYYIIDSLFCLKVVLNLSKYHRGMHRFSEYSGLVWLQTEILKI